MKHYQATVTFWAEGTVYGKESYPVTGTTAKEALEMALTLSEESIYADPRIEYTPKVHLDELEDEPTQTLSCPACQSNNLARKGQVFVEQGKYSEVECRCECEGDADFYVCECGYGFIPWEGCEKEA